MPEEHPLAGTNLPLADQVQQPGHRLAGVDRVQEDTLQLGYQSDRVSFGFGDHGVATAQVAIIDEHIVRANAELKT